MPVARDEGWGGSRFCRCSRVVWRFYDSTVLEFERLSSNFDSNMTVVNPLPHKYIDMPYLYLCINRYEWEREREQQCKYPWIPLPLGWLNLSLSDFEGFGELLTAQMAAIQQVLSLNEALCRRRKTPHLGHLGRMGWKSYSNTGYIKLQYRCHYTHLYIYTYIYMHVYILACDA